MKGFRSPLISQPSSNNVEKINVSRNEEKIDNSKKSVRNNLKILNIFEEAIEEERNCNNIQIKNNVSNKRDINNLEEKTSLVVATEAKR